MSSPTVIVIVVALLGALARVVLPYLQQVQENPGIKFDRQFLVPPLVACVIAVVTLPVTLAALPKDLLEATTISPTMMLTAFLAAYGLTDVSRLVQKVVTAQFAKGSAVGQGLVEYALILVLVALVAIVILALVGPAIGEVFSNIVSNI